MFAQCVALTRVYQLEVLPTTLSFIGIIFFTICFELLDHRLMHALENTIYLAMLQKIYKELTILGFISFGVFMTINTADNLHVPTLLAFEFAHIVIFFSAMFFIFQSIMMMLLSRAMKQRIDFICAEPIPELLNQYHSQGFRHHKSAFHVRLFRYNDIRNQIETKIMQHFFLDQYALQVCQESEESKSD